MEDVKRGAALLDTYEPGWADRIDLNALDMDFADQCILGQLYGDYFTVFYPKYGTMKPDLRRALTDPKSEYSVHNCGFLSLLSSANDEKAWTEEVLARRGS